MAERITRRALGGAIAAAAALPAQNPPETPSSPEDLLQAARTQLKAAREQIAKVPLDTAVEPAAHFEA